MGTNTACEHVEAERPARPLATAACTGSDSLSGSTSLSEAALVVSSAVRKIILVGTAPVITVANPR
uniref:Uncharacterized protein n=1 Tax=Arundo donax TaxID=35708 RepID=A0A0A9D090_ARUDO